jgi:hypothetical protein
MERRRLRPDFDDDIEDVKYGGAVAELLAASPYLLQTDRDWETYWAEMKRELMNSNMPAACGRYSQYAATFLLTLLPNVESVYLPRLWQPIDTSNKLLDAIARNARRACGPSESPTLALTTRIHGKSKQANMRWTYHIAALPRLRSVKFGGLRHHRWLNITF